MLLETKELLLFPSLVLEDLIFLLFVPSLDGLGGTVLFLESYFLIEGDVVSHFKLIIDVAVHQVGLLEPTDCATIVVSLLLGFTISSR